MMVGTALGRNLLKLRESLHLVQTAWLHPEAVGMLANDSLAGKLVTGICLPDKVFIDVGAHIGSITAGVLHQTPSARVIAFEAIPDKVEHLRRKFPRVEFHGCAVGEKSGEVTFFVHTKRSGYSSLGRPSKSALSDMREIVVPMQTLDELIDSNGVDVIKIDVEGAELGVLRGGANLIDRCRPTILFESGPWRDDGLGYSKEALWQWFVDRDFQILVPNRVAHNDSGLTQGCFMDSHLYPRRATNYFAIPTERRAEVRDRARAVLKLK